MWMLQEELLLDPVPNVAKQGDILRHPEEVLPELLHSGKSFSEEKLHSGRDVPNGENL